MTSPSSGSERVVVVGAGIVGLAIARHLARVGQDVVVLDKEPEVARHQSGHNSGVVHSGVYYPPGSLKARLCRRGVGLLRELCDEHGLEYLEIGKVIVARDESELDRLRDLEGRAQANGVPGVRRLTARELREIEPHVAGVAALHSPTTAIVDFRRVARAMADDIRALGGELRLGEAVTGVESRPGGVEVVTTRDRLRGRRVVLCAGLHSDVLARAAGDDRSPEIVPFRGEYLRLVPERTGLVRGLVYPVPDPAYPFLGVHVTPRVDGTVDIGPNAVLATAREGYRWTDVEPRLLWRHARSRAVRSLFRTHWRAGVHELRGSLSTRAYVRLARQYLPELRVADVVRAGSGVRAQAVDPDGALVDDFRISTFGPVTALRNAPSPAATSSLAIAEYVVGQLDVVRTDGTGDR